MVTYPIFVERKTYRGRDARKCANVAQYNRDAAMLEEHINEQIRGGKFGVFYYAKIASEVRLPERRVRDILFSVDCGHNGFTVVKGAAK
jgi:hypothetical protein